MMGKGSKGTDKRFNACIKICCLQYKSPISAMAKSKGRVSIVKTSLAKHWGKRTVPTIPATKSNDYAVER